jgi:predicted CXXCH cytochrome family protein
MAKLSGNAPTNYIGKNTQFPITCAVCHDPHYAANSGQLRAPIDNPEITANLCTSCHVKGEEARRSFTINSRGAHASQGAVYFGEAAGWTPPGFVVDPDNPVQTSHVILNQRLCAGCHVVKFTTTDASTGQDFTSVGHLFSPDPCKDANGLPTTGDCAYTATARFWTGCTNSGCHADANVAANLFNGTRAEVKLLIDILWVDSDHDTVLETTDGGLLPAVLAQHPSTTVAATDSAWYCCTVDPKDNNLSVAEGALFNARMLGEELYGHNDGSKESTTRRFPWADRRLDQCRRTGTACRTCCHRPRRPRSRRRSRRRESGIPDHWRRDRPPEGEPAPERARLMLATIINGTAALVAAASIRQDTATIRVPGHGEVLDSTVDHTLLPDTITPIVQWIFQKPPWLMWSGAVLAVLLGLGALWWLRGHIKAVVQYLASRSGLVKAALVAAVLLLVVGAAAAGMKSYDFMMNDKRMCNGCHVFVPSGQVIERPDTGDYTLVNKLEGKHDTLNCHACHAFNARKEAVKMVLWMSGVRDSTIPKHGTVPRNVRTVPQAGEAKKTWQAIAKTAGHRTH